MPRSKQNPAGWKNKLVLIPFVGPILEKAYWRLRKIQFDNSADYWEERYKSGKSSGAGSYGQLSLFKAEVLNTFVSENKVRSVVELGCGDGHQLSLAKYPEYLGLDISAEAISICREKFGDDNTKTFCGLDEAKEHDAPFDLAMSLDVIYHLIEDEVFTDYMKRLFSLSNRFVIIYASNKEEPTPSPHVRHRRFTDWIASEVPQWTHKQTIPNRFPFDPENADQTSFADFYMFQRS